MNRKLQNSSTSATYYYFNRDVLETEYILSMYERLVPPPVLQYVRTYRYNNIEQEKQRNRVTVDDLVQEDLQNQMNVRFTSIVTILQSLTKDLGTSAVALTIGKRSSTISYKHTANHLPLKPRVTAIVFKP